MSKLEQQMQQFFESQNASASMASMAANARNNTSAIKHQGTSVIGKGPSRIDDITEAASMMQTLGDSTVGRGINKSSMTPAQRQGLFPQNPQYFGLQAKQPIPYQKLVADGQNLYQLLRGFQEAKTAPVGDAAAAISSLQRRSTLISEAFRKSSTQSIYTGLPMDPAINLLNIQLKNSRENSLYALQ